MGIHTFHITDICPLTNMPPTLLTDVPLQFHCSVHTEPTILQISIRNHYIVTFIYHTTENHGASNKYDPKMLHICHMPTFSLCVNGGSMSKCIPHMNSLT